MPAETPVVVQETWPGADGAAIDCREKLRVLRENQAELRQMLRDCFEDAVLMGVDAEGMRRILHALVDDVPDPRRQSVGVATSGS